MAWPNQRWPNQVWPNQVGVVGGPNGPVVISALFPSAAPVGQYVTIRGAGFGQFQGSSIVTFSGSPVPVSSWSPLAIVVIVPQGAVNGPVAVIVGGVQSNLVNFTVMPSVIAFPKLSIVPLAFDPGDTASLGAVSSVIPHATFIANEGGQNSP